MADRPLWLTQRERGSARLMRLVVRLALRFGRPFGRVLLYPICAYFLVFSTAARRASRDYLLRAVGPSRGWSDVFRHYHTFAATILDRVFLLAGKSQLFRFDVEGLDLLETAMARGRGCLLFGAHFGSFEVLRVLARRQSPVRIRVLMHEHANAHGRLPASKHAQHLEAPEVGAEQKASPTARHRRLQQVEALDIKAEQLRFSGKKEHPVENGRGERVVMPEYVAPPS